MGSFAYFPERFALWSRLAQITEGKVDAQSRTSLLVLFAEW
jgi:hypothetical protein